MSAPEDRVQALITRVLERYALPNMRAAERKLSELGESPGDAKDRLLLELALAAYQLECGLQVEMTIALHPSDKAAIEREAEKRETTPAELMTMATLRQMRTHPIAD